MKENQGEAEEESTAVEQLESSRWIPSSRKRIKKPRNTKVTHENSSPLNKVIPLPTNVETPNSTSPLTIDGILATGSCSSIPSDAFPIFETGGCSTPFRVGTPLRVQADETLENVVEPLDHLDTLNKYFGFGYFPIIEVEQEKLCDAIKALHLVTSEFVTPEHREICQKIIKKLSRSSANLCEINDKASRVAGKIDETSSVITEQASAIVEKHIPAKVADNTPIQTLEANELSFPTVARTALILGELPSSILGKHVLTYEETLQNSPTLEELSSIVVGKHAVKTEDNSQNSLTVVEVMPIIARQQSVTAKDTPLNSATVAEKSISTEAEHVVEKPTSIEAKNVDSITSLSNMQIASVVANINSSYTSAEQDSPIFGVPSVEEKHLGQSLYTHLGYFSSKS
ncbi:hypothetical protein M9H77_26373 [Catharanthus roseus]|uniref:Uncharacterized protein n=1 Tax=Catharanthus roseus TaxID=4058 RepID=A0ACC0A9L0_CATRO|nr:hypothetical protein M9H77_26373 [Catharanthus roseus]